MINEITLLQFADYSSNGNGWNKLVDCVLDNVKNGFVLVNGFYNGDNNALLVLLANSLGYPITSNVTGSENRIVHRIESLNEPKNDCFGEILYSSTAMAFPCHTDNAGKNFPADIVIVQCIRPADDGGKTFLVHVDDIVKKLSDTELSLLCEAVFPFPCGREKIISYKGGKPQIRYNRHYINMCLNKYNEELDMKYRKVLNYLDEVIAFGKISREVQLNYRDCIIINNKTTLHGRSKFPQNSRRLLKRIRVNLSR